MCESEGSMSKEYDPQFPDPGVETRELQYAEMQKRFGAYLQAQRQLRRMSLEEISQHIRAPIHKLKALESGEFHRLPKMPFVAGLVQAYAKYVGCDVDEMMAKLKEFEPAIEAKLNLEGVGKPSDQELYQVDRPAFFITRRMMLGLVLVGISVVFLWFGLDAAGPFLQSLIQRDQQDSSPAVSSGTDVPEKNTRNKDPERVSEDPSESLEEPVSNLGGRFSEEEAMLVSTLPNVVKIKHDSEEPLILKTLNPGEQVPLSFKGEIHLWALHPEFLSIHVKGENKPLQWSNQQTRIQF
jgi:cytoskeletal protein RodZ